MSVNQMLLCGGLLFLLIYGIWALRVWWHSISRPRAIQRRHENTGGDFVFWSSLDACSSDSGASHHDSGSSFDSGSGSDGGGGSGGGD